MKIRDSASNNLISIKSNDVTIYNCGPTVYNHVHIGNIRPVITIDVLIRFLQQSHFNVKYVHNITDIDDKIINLSLSRKTSSKKISKGYFLVYKKLLKSLNIISPEMPKVSDNIQDIILFIKNLVKLGFAYQVKGDVYFDVSKIEKYGSISHQLKADLLDGVRKQNKKYKRNPLDFVLWKQTSSGDSWKSPWSNGRPGWHTECVCLINKYLGKQVTIHAGGIDLKFPHHENENAQNIALNSIDLAKIWLHIGHLTVSQEKMSKSKNNYVLAKDIIQLCSADVVKWFMFQTHYKSPLNFSEKLLEQSWNDFNKIKKIIRNTMLFLNYKKVKIISADLPENVVDCIEDDLNIPNVISIVWEKCKSISLLISKKEYAQIAQIISELQTIFNVLGLEYKFKQSFFSKIRYQKWQHLIAQKKYVEADKIREKLDI